MEYVRKINPKKSFLKKYQNQKNLRHIFYEEFKITGFNYIILLFENVIRVVTTVEENKPDLEKDKDQIFKSKDEIFLKRHS